MNPVMLHIATIFALLFVGCMLAFCVYSAYQLCKHTGLTRKSELNRAPPLPEIKRDPPFCCNCEHRMLPEVCITSPTGEDYSVCRATAQPYLKSKHYLVTGVDLNKGKIGYQYCSVERIGICSDDCGVEGKNFKPKQAKEGETK